MCLGFILGSFLLSFWVLFELMLGSVLVSFLGVFFLASWGSVRALGLILGLEAPGDDF